MNKVLKLIKFMVSGTILILIAIFLAYTMVAFVYYYYHLHQDPMHYFQWWYSHVRGFDFKKYLIFAFAFEVVLLISGIVVTWKQIK